MNLFMKYFSSKICTLEKSESVSPPTTQELNTNVPSPYNGSLITSDSDNLSTVNSSLDEIELFTSQPHEQSPLDDMEERNGHESEANINSVICNVKVEDAIDESTLMETDHVIHEGNEKTSNFDNVDRDINLNDTLNVNSNLDVGFDNDTFAVIKAAYSCSIPTRTKTVETIVNKSDDMFIEDQFEIGKVDPDEIESLNYLNDFNNFHEEQPKTFNASENSEVDPVYADLATVDTYLDYYQNFIKQSKNKIARNEDYNFMVNNTQHNIGFASDDEIATELLKDMEFNNESKDKVYDKSSNFKERSNINSALNEYLNMDDFEPLLPSFNIANDVARMETISISFEDIQQLNTADSDCDGYNSSDFEFITEKEAKLDGISSEDIQQLNTVDSDCDGYNSSDFEFITEKEAKLDGLIINFRSQNNKTKSRQSPKTRTIDITVSHDNKLNLPGGSSKDKKTKKYYKAENRDSLDHCYKNNHVVPEGEAYLHLFQGYYNPAVIDSWHNKAIDYSQRTTNAMLVEYKGIGFDMQVLNAKNGKLNNYSKEVKQEAKATLNKILDMYPHHNRKRPRRY